MLGAIFLLMFACSLAGLLFSYLAFLYDCSEHKITTRRVFLIGLIPFGYLIYVGNKFYRTLK